MKIIIECYELEYLIENLLHDQAVIRVFNECKKKCDECKKESEKSFKRDGRDI